MNVRRFLDPYTKDDYEIGRGRKQIKKGGRKNRKKAYKIAKKKLYKFLDNTDK